MPFIKSIHFYVDIFHVINLDQCGLSLILSLCFCVAMENFNHDFNRNKD